LPYLFHKGISVGLFESLKSRPPKNWRKTKSTTKAIKISLI
jgi:hypothetical protein